VEFRLRFLAFLLISSASLWGAEGDPCTEKVLEVSVGKQTPETPEWEGDEFSDLLNVVEFADSPNALSLHPEAQQVWDTHIGFIRVRIRSAKIADPENAEAEALFWVSDALAEWDPNLSSDRDAYVMTKLRHKILDYRRRELRGRGIRGQLNIARARSMLFKKLDRQPTDDEIEKCLKENGKSSSRAYGLGASLSLYSPSRGKIRSDGEHETIADQFGTPSRAGINGIDRSDAIAHTVEVAWSEWTTRFRLSYLTPKPRDGSPIRRAVIYAKLSLMGASFTQMQSFFGESKSAMTARTAQAREIFPELNEAWLVAAGHHHFRSLAHQSEAIGDGFSSAISWEFLLKQLEPAERAFLDGSLPNNTEVNGFLKEFEKGIKKASTRHAYFEWYLELYDWTVRGVEAGDAVNPESRAALLASYPRLARPVFREVLGWVLLPPRIFRGDVK
jgi:hypothetical protein